MNIHTARYQMLKRVISEHGMYEMLNAHLPVCAVDVTLLVKGIELEERAALARTGIDRARFLAKHDRSKYTPHTGMKELIKAGGRMLDNAMRRDAINAETIGHISHYKPEDNT